MEVEVEGSTYRTWPDRMGVVGSKRDTSAGRRPSLSGLLVTKSPKNLEALDVLRRPTLATALSSLSISYSPKTRGLHDSQANDRMVPTESQRAKVPTEDTETKCWDDLRSKSSDSDRSFLRSDNSTCDDWNPRCGSEQLVVAQTKLGPSENEPESVETDSDLPAEEKERGALSKEAQLQDDENQCEVLAENQGEVLGQQRYVPTHRKAFSLPRTLEVRNVRKTVIFFILPFFCWTFLFVVEFDHQMWAEHLCPSHCHIETLVCIFKIDLIKLTN